MITTRITTALDGEWISADRMGGMFDALQPWFAKHAITTWTIRETWRIGPSHWLYLWNKLLDVTTSGLSRFQDVAFDCVSGLEVSPPPALAAQIRQCTVSNSNELSRLQPWVAHLDHVKVEFALTVDLLLACPRNIVSLSGCNVVATRVAKEDNVWRFQRL